MWRVPVSGLSKARRLVDFAEELDAREATPVRHDGPRPRCLHKSTRGQESLSYSPVSGPEEDGNAPRTHGRPQESRNKSPAPTRPDHPPYPPPNTPTLS